MHSSTLSNKHRNHQYKIPEESIPVDLISVNITYKLLEVKIGKSRLPLEFIPVSNESPSDEIHG